jgi:RNA polymerase sigma-70 factor (ECF subfamily)
MHTTSPKPLRQFDRLVEFHYSALFNFAVRLSSNPERALELTQRAFRLALERSRELPVPKNVREWLFTILFREFLELRPRRPRRPRFAAPRIELVLEGNPQLN